MLKLYLKKKMKIRKFVIKKIERNLAPAIIVITSQRIRELDHIMRKEVNETIRMIIKWKSQKRKPLVKPRKKVFCT
jgi:hypothetical protein